MTPRRPAGDSRCAACGAVVVWVTLDDTAAGNEGRRVAIDLRPAAQGGTLEKYWSAGGRRMARVHPLGSGTLVLHRPHFATCTSSTRRPAPRPHAEVQT